MLSKTSRKDVAKEKVSDLASAVADAAEAGREKIAPVVKDVAGQLSEAADKASDAAAPHIARAKDAVADAAAPQIAKAKEATADAADTAAPQLAKAKEVAADAAAPHVEKAKKAAKEAADNATDAAAPRVKKARKTARKAAKQATKDAAKIKASAADRAEAAGLTTQQAHRLFADEWMPRIQETIAATAAAGTSAYAALPQQARDAVETVAPQVAKKRRKKGKLLIALGLLAGAGAVALYVSGQQKAGTKKPQVTAPEIEKLDVNPVEDTMAAPTSDDAVGDLEKKVDASVGGSRRGRHAAKE